MPKKRSEGASSGPGGFLEMRARMAERYPHLSPQLQLIAQFALANPESMAVETAAQLANRLEVQPSSLVRFAQALDYRGFNEMKRGFRDHLIFRLADKRDDRAGTPSVDGREDILRSLVDEAKAGMDRLTSDLDPGAFAEGVAALKKADQIYVVAQQIAFPFASLFVWTMLRFGRRCHILDNTGGFALRQSELTGRNDAILAVSLAPYQPSVVQSAKSHAERGGTVVAITDSPVSPIAPFASILLEVPQHQPSTGRSLAEVTCLVQALAISVAGGEEHGSGEP